ncbi:MAG: ABC transporter substrate-binding protein [Alcanivorax sp.]|nr:MAG: ABC transporter substrate-binding protein [Alcanivorax sp.]
MFQRLTGLLLAVALCLSAYGVQAADNRLILTGSSTVAPLVLEMAKRYEQQHPQVRIDVQTGGSTRGVNDTRTGLAHIGMASRNLKPTETGLHVHTIAIDGVGIIVHRSNPISSLSNTQIIDIYTGKIRNWKDVGGRDLSITVVNKAEGHSTLELFLNYFALKNSQVRPSIIIGDNEQGIKTVAGNPGAIGYVSIGAAEFSQARGVTIKRLPLEGVAASVAEVQAHRFPLARPLNLLTGKSPSPLARRFIAFAQSEAVADLIADQFFVVPR